MSWIAKAVLAAALLNCGLLNASAQEPAQGPAQGPAQATAQASAQAPAQGSAQGSAKGEWLKDGNCALFSANAQPGGTVKWTGACLNGYAEGLGTATFTHDGQEQSFTAAFSRGVIPDGHVVMRWGAGWSYEGETVDGRFNGHGVLTTDAKDRFEGEWAGGKMAGFGTLLRANGERYAGDWADDKPNGKGELRLADGSVLAGIFADGKLTKVNAPAAASPVPAPIPSPAGGPAAPFGAVSGKTLTGVDGSSATLNLIEGGMELRMASVDANTRRVAFTFMTDRMGTVVEDQASPNAGSSVSGFFRLTDQGMEIHYADGRSAKLSPNSDGGLQLEQGRDTGVSCRAWYPPGHAFNEAEKKMALNAYAEKLGLPSAGGETGTGCSPAAKHADNRADGFVPVAMATSAASPPPAAASPARAKRLAAAKKPARSYQIGEYQPLKSLEPVAVKTSEVHLVDSSAVTGPAAAIMAPSAGGAAPGDKMDASRCLKVDSNGIYWGFRNSCDFAVQFAYCMAGGSDSLTACGRNVTVSSVGSVAANGFGVLMADTSLKEQDAAHNFRWIACGGGAGEVMAHLDHAEPPAGRCVRSRTASAN